MTSDKKTKAAPHRILTGPRGKLRRLPSSLMLLLFFFFFSPVATFGSYILREAFHNSVSFHSLPSFECLRKPTPYSTAASLSVFVGSLSCLGFVSLGFKSWCSYSMFCKPLLRINWEAGIELGAGDTKWIKYGVRQQELTGGGVGRWANGNVPRTLRDVDTAGRTSGAADSWIFGYNKES